MKKINGWTADTLMMATQIRTEVQLIIAGIRKGGCDPWK